MGVSVSASSSSVSSLSSASSSDISISTSSSLSKLNAVGSSAPTKPSITSSILSSPNLTLSIKSKISLIEPGHSLNACTISFKASSIFLAMTISSSRLSNSTAPISRIYIRTGSVVRPNSESTVDKAASASASASSSLTTTVLSFINISESALSSVTAIFILPNTFNKLSN